jgi:replicative DNA helicase
LAKLQNESEENKKNLEEMLKQIDEIKKKKKEKKEEAKCVIDEFSRTIKELENKKKEMMQQIDNEIKFNTTEMNKVMKSSEKEIKSLDKKQKDLNKKADTLKEKLGIPVEKKPKLKSRAKVRPKPKPKEKKHDDPNNFAEKIKMWGDYLKLNSEQIANNLSQKYEFFKNILTPQLNEEIHYQYICDGCEMAPIKGVRYHCEKCRDFDFCEKCYKEKKDQHGHSFQAIKKSIVLPPQKPNCVKFCGKTVHRTVTCDGCGKFPIVGIRYKCGVCPNFDFCEECEKKEGMKQGHPMVRLPSLNMLRNIKIN